MSWRGLVLFLVLSLPAGCQQSAPPIWYVPADTALSAGEVESRTARVLDDLGYQIESFDPKLALISTRWLHDSHLLSTRFQVLVRLKQTEPYGVAVTVPRQVHDGLRWIPDGEEERRRKELVASLTARLAARPEARP